ncbi:hypothetical protein G7Z17_g12674 [Cylindrodendrum hubeiense]|uniref:Uncharacterized protein n=1 Tax=Cylindrodendrum hubeiense TaxID=595255 RepID=A0A9P5H2K1_9HYPO|nr:hypothetical protein G7Z17_g12674 [Cylindrodendrum hubeiense]
MFGSYGSYSSMCAASAPMDITSRSMSSHDSTCAFPSWPRRSSLSESDREERPTSYLSDDDLFLSDPFDDDTRSVSSAGSASSPHSGAASPHIITDAEFLEMERQRQAMQREFVRGIVTEKERRRAVARKQRKSSPSSKKSPKSKLSSMAPIAE